MSKPWEQQGCPVCRGLWASGGRPPELAINLDLHLRLHRCASCETYWEQHERFAQAVDVDTAESHFPAEFAKG